MIACKRNRFIDRTNYKRSAKVMNQSYRQPSHVPEEDGNTLEPNEWKHKQKNERLTLNMQFQSLEFSSIHRF